VPDLAQIEACVETARRWSVPAERGGELKVWLTDGGAVVNFYMARTAADLRSAAMLCKLVADAMEGT
jgi:hypothetical protein